MAVKSKKPAQRATNLMKSMKQLKKELLNEQEDEKPSVLEEDSSDGEEVDDDEDVKTPAKKVTKTPVKGNKDQKKGAQAATPEGKTTLGQRNSRSVFVRRLKRDTSDEDISEFFGAAGKIIKTRFIRSQKAAIVLFEKEDSVKKAVALTKTHCKGQEVLVERVKSSAPSTKDKNEKKLGKKKLQKLKRTALKEKTAKQNAPAKKTTLKKETKTTATKAKKSK